MKPDYLASKLVIRKSKKGVITQMAVVLLVGPPGLEKVRRQRKSVVNMAGTGFRQVPCLEIISSARLS